MWFGGATTTRYGVGPGLSRKSGGEINILLTARSAERYAVIKRRVSRWWLPAAPAPWTLLRRGAPRPCPPFLLKRGYPSGAKLVLGHPAARLPGFTQQTCPAFISQRFSTSIHQIECVASKTRGLRRFHTYGLRSGDPPASCPPFVLQRGYPRERISSGSGVRSEVRAPVPRHPRHRPRRGLQWGTLFP